MCAQIYIHTPSWPAKFKRLASQTWIHPGKRVISPAHLKLRGALPSLPYPAPLLGPELEEGALTIARNKRREKRGAQLERVD